MATKLYVGNLSFTTTEGDLKEHFATCGTVVSCNVIMDKYTNKSRGFAFVEMGSQDDARAAITALNGREIGGRALTVNEAKEQAPRRGGGGGGGGGFGGRRGGHRGY